MLNFFVGVLTTITIAPTETVEDELRNLLRKEREKNRQLNEDYQCLQKRNLELISNLDNMKKENEGLVKENRKLYIASKTYFHDKVSPEHSYK